MRNTSVGLLWLILLWAAPVAIGLDRAGVVSNAGKSVLRTDASGPAIVGGSQAGGLKYNPGSVIGHSFVPEKADQTITFEQLINRNIGDPDFDVIATASSGLEVSITATGRCTVNGLTVQLAGVGSCTLTASQAGNTSFNPAPSVSQSFFIGTTGENVFDLRSFGAVGDGTTDDGPALQQALNALAAAGGGTLFVPAGRFAIATPVSKVFTGLITSISIRGIESDTTVVTNTGVGSELATGLKLVSELYPKTGSQQTALDLAGLENLLIADIAMVGSPDVQDDALVTLSIRDIEMATVRHCEFYGLKSTNGAIVFAQRSGLRIDQTKFLGSFGHSGTYTPNVQNIEWKSIELTDVVFLDYGTRPELYCKCAYGATFSWVNIGNAAPVTPKSPRREVSFRGVFLDEGAYNGLTALPSLYQPPSAPIDLVYISGLRMNVSNFGTSGNYLSGLQRVMIEDSYYGWSHNADSAINLLGAGNAILDQVECVASANRIRADTATGKLTVINSEYTHLDSQAQNTKVITTTAPNDDPVQHVRTKFLAVLNREPDAAAHFYWSDLLLNCGEDTVCSAEKRAAFDAYLSTTPAPKFSIAGQVRDEDGVPLPGVNVALAGSQSVTTQTDGEGRYLFEGLPTSGVYAITPSREHYTFVVPSGTISTPASDQTLDFAAIHNRYRITGRLLSDTGMTLGSSSVILSGGEAATATTDAEGNYSFTVEAEGDYIVTPARANYTFAPAATVLNYLAGDETANFTGTLMKYALTGRVTVDGNALSGVTVTLGGSQTGTTTTVSNGNYSFTATAEGNYTVTPSHIHYSFSPQQLSYTALSGNANADFAATLNHHSITGKVTKSDGTPLPGTILVLSGGQTATTLSDGSGNYSFANLPAAADYIITISRANYLFSPASVSVTALASNQTENFTGTPVDYVLSGRITQSGSGLSNVTVTLSGSQSMSIATNSSGDYSFVVKAEGNYSVAPSKQHFSFNPSSLTYNGLSSNQTSNFAGTLNQHSISGRITTMSGSSVQNVIVSLSGSQTATATSDASGAYSFSNLAAGGNYTVTPAKTDSIFSPASATVTDLGSNQTIDFNESPVVYTISGRVVLGSEALSGVLITLSGSQSATATTNASGDYSFNVNVHGNYTVTPSLSSHTFYPANQTFNNLSGNQTANFGKQPSLFVASLSGAQEVPPNNSSATGTATLLLSPDEKEARLALNFSGLSSAQTDAHIHGPAAPGSSAAPRFPLANGNLNDVVITMTPADVQNLKNGLLYIDVHSANFPSGEIRGQFGSNPSASSFQLNSANLNVAENAGTVLVTVTRIGSTSGAASVNYAITNGTASSPSDFIAANGTISFSAGETFKTFPVSIVDDLFVEANETVNLTLSNATGGAFLGSPHGATVTTVNNDYTSSSPPGLLLDASGPDANQAAALDSLLLLRDPFRIRSVAEWLDFGTDRNTRVLLFASNLSLAPGESASAVVVNLVDSNNQSFDVAAEDVRVTPNPNSAQVTFRLPDNLAAGICTVKLKVHNTVSNAVTFRILP